MAIVFSATNAGIVEQARSLAGVDSTQWPTQKIVNSANNWHDFVAGYAIGADRRFQWDDTNHTKLPEGTATLTQDVTDYSFLADEQGNSIITLTGLSILVNGYYQPLVPVDRNDPSYDPATFGAVSGTPTSYDKIADNIIRLDYKPVSTVSAGIKFFFQRTGSYFTSSDTTKSPGVSPLLHRGYVIAAAYDIALTLGLGNLPGLASEKQTEEQKVIQYFSTRNQDENRVLTTEPILYQ
jgi:hypothetical protein